MSAPNAGREPVNYWNNVCHCGACGYHDESEVWKDDWNLDEPRVCVKSRKVPGSNCPKCGKRMWHQTGPSLTPDGEMFVWDEKEIPDFKAKSCNGGVE